MAKGNGAMGARGAAARADARRGAAAIPTAVGMAACMLFTAAVRLVT